MYDIHDLAAILEIPANTLRWWVARGALRDPKRLKDGNRFLFNNDDVAVAGMLLSLQNLFGASTPLVHSVAGAMKPILRGVLDSTDRRLPPTIPVPVADGAVEVVLHLDGWAEKLRGKGAAWRATATA